MEKLLAHRYDICILISLLTDKIYLLCQFLEILIQLDHLVLECLVIQTHKIQFITAVLKSVYIRSNGTAHLILRLSCILQLYHSLSSAAHKSCIIDNTCRSLDLSNHDHDTEKQHDQYHRQHCHTETHDI